MRAAVLADAEAGIGAGQDHFRILRMHHDAAHDAVELDGLLEAEAVPVRAVVDAAQEALARRSNQNRPFHLGSSLTLKFPLAAGYGP